MTGCKNCIAILKQQVLDLARKGGMDKTTMLNIQELYGEADTPYKWQIYRLQLMELKNIYEKSLKGDL
jgi:hypothetical protein